MDKFFGSVDDQTQVLKDVSLEINQGDFVSITGPSGSGKSTLLSILGLVEKPSTGTHLLSGLQVNQLNDSALARARNAHIGFVFQSFNLIDYIDVFENVSLPFRFRREKVSEDEIRLHVYEALDVVDMRDKAGYLPNQLSGGQQQRVAIARAIVCKPNIILADEPTGNLDQKNGRLVMNKLIELNKAGTTICLVTHEPEFASMATKRFTIVDGSITGMEM